MSTLVYVKIFNDILDQFLEQLENDFHFLRADISLTKTTVRLIRHGNPRMVVEGFMSYAGKYRQQIQDCDEDFFLDYKKNLKDSLTDETLMFSDKLKRVWTAPDTTQVQKAMVFMYLQKLLKAGDRCS